MLDVGDTSANKRLSFKQTDIHAARGQQCGCGQTSNASAHDDYFAIHWLAEKTEQFEHAVNRLVSPVFKAGAKVRLNNDDDRLNAIEDEVDDKAGQQPPGASPNDR